MAWLDFFIYNCPNSYAATGSRTHVSRDAPNSRDHLKDTLPTELHGRGRFIGVFDGIRHSSAFELGIGAATCILRTKCHRYRRHHNRLERSPENWLNQRKRFFLINNVHVLCMNASQNKTQQPKEDKFPPTGIFCSGESEDFFPRTKPVIKNS